jgi:hypothetical protein
MTPEGRVKEKVKKIFRKHNAYYHMPVQNGMGAPSLDFVACVAGRYVAVETKAPGGKPTARQLNTIGEIEQSGGLVFVLDGNQDSMDDFDSSIGELT